MKTIFLWLIALMFLGSGLAYAGDYTDSAHGNSGYGVDRTSTDQYTEGHCAHCHEQHASIGGAEPEPNVGNVASLPGAAGPDNYLLFDQNHYDQTHNFCFDCHCGSTGGYQTGGLENRSYSYRAGGYTADGLNDILEAFSSTSAHNLDNIVTAITDQWGYTANSNPCAACHNPHVAQGDPANLPNSAKTTSTTRGWPVTLPSKHGSSVAADIFWGDGSGEKMSDYVGTDTYQAPYRYYTDSPLYLEPLGHSKDDPGPTNAAASTTDYVTFCLDCHSSELASDILTTTKVINWANSKHGELDSGGTDASDRKQPYTAEKNYILACTDCHEPHGSPNYKYLIRKEVNGGTTDVSENTYAAWLTFCGKCHQQVHNKGNGYCIDCHYHGAWISQEYAF